MGRFFEFQVNGKFVRVRRDKSRGNNHDMLPMLCSGLVPPELLGYEKFEWHAGIYEVEESPQPVKWTLKMKVDLLKTLPWMVFGLNERQTMELMCIRDTLSNTSDLFGKTSRGRIMA